MVAFKTWKCSINKKMLPMKLHYLFYALGTGAVLPFFPLIAKDIGISATGLGITFTVVPFFTVVLNPIFGFLTDKFKKIKFIIMLFIVSQTIFYIPINYIPKIDSNINALSDVLFHCNGESASIFMHYSNIPSIKMNNKTIECHAVCSLSNNTESFPQKMTFNVTSGPVLNDNKTLQVMNTSLENFTSMACSGVFRDKCNVMCFVNEHHQVNSFLHYQYWLFVTFTAVGIIITDAVIAISDAACHEDLEGRVNQFGKQRVWLSIGWGIIQLSTGYMVEYLNENNTGNTDFSVCFYIMIPLILLDVISVCYTDMKKEKTSKNIFKDVRKIFIKPHPFIFLTAVFLVGVTDGMMWTYAFWYYEGLGANKIFMGISSAVNIMFAEVPFMFISGWIIKRIGRDNSMTMAFVSNSIWCLTASFIYNPWWIIIPNLLQGPAYGLFHAVMTSYGKLVAPPGTEATMQTILGAAFHGLGIGAGSLLGGFGFDNYGGRTTYRFLGYFVLGTAIVYKCITSFIAGENTVIKENIGMEKMEISRKQDSN